ncbi:FkbM family methyltransferase [Cesiribacter andamanensis]|uniref:Methyltransferase, FkbM family n=1 Tax=Cesiribacter andamanensis AMV16 TaxID=1279009 RepID=M7NZC9_9BACT|nr:FkbM family methyltransferase [Cesiribacter andamanensis]EMR03704.1 methyltransferase, FkbM family [Cesiribacter andamanensis AMV16]
MIKPILRSIYRQLPFKKQLFHIIRKFWKPHPSLYQHLHFQGVFKVPIDKDHSFLMRHYGYQIENELFWSGIQGGWEKESLGIWVALCQNATTILDIGANTGIYALIAKTVNPHSRIYAFEPVKRVYEKLVANNTLNGYDILCLEKAVSDADGEAIIYDLPSEHVYSVTVNKNLNAPTTSTIETRIRTIKLASFIEENGLDSIDLIKVDVETHEPEVLKGMEHYLQKFQPTLLIEVLTEEVADQLNTLLKDLPYLYFNIDENKGIRQVNQIGKSDYYNFLCCDHATASMLKLL